MVKDAILQPLKYWPATIAANCFRRLMMMTQYSVAVVFSPVAKRFNRTRVRRNSRCHEIQQPVTHKKSRFEKAAYK